MTAISTKRRVRARTELEREIIIVTQAKPMQMSGAQPPGMRAPADTRAQAASLAPPPPPRK